MMDFRRPKILVLFFSMFVMLNSFTQSASSRLNNKTLIVSSILGAPYLMLTPDVNVPKRKGNDRFEGYIRDLLEEASYKVGFKYEIKLVPDGQYGSKQASGDWNGIVGEVIKRNADIGAAALTITSERERVADFTKPFLRTGITTLSKKSRMKPTTNLFLFLEPFRSSVWIVIVISYLLVGLAICCFEKWLAPSSADNKRSEQSSKLQNAMSSTWGFWWAFRTITWQGVGRAPKSCPARILSVFWLMLVVCILSLYIATLVSRLPQIMTSPGTTGIKVNELVKQTRIKYGTVHSGSTYQFFRSSAIPTYERMWNVMSSSRPSVFVDSVQEGIRKVSDGNYVFLGESTTFDYIEGQNCDLRAGDNLLDSKGYGLITPLGSSLRDRLSLAVLEMRESGRLDMIYKKWFLNNRKCGISQKDDQYYVTATNLADVGGPFIILLVGFVLSLLAAVTIVIRKCCKRQKGFPDVSAKPATDENKTEAASPV